MSKKWLTLGVLCAVWMVLGVSFAAADAPVEGRAGRAEVRFLEGMIDHHQMALDMAADCLTKATTESVTTLCQNVINAQSAEIEMMRGWLLDWYNIDYTPMPMASLMGDDMGDMGDHGGMEGMNMPATDPALMMGMFAGFNRLEGIEYEIAWLESMIDHHDDAIHMSERLLNRVADGHSELSDLANKIISDQSGEIAAMEDLITELSA